MEIKILHIFPNFRTWTTLCRLIQIQQLLQAVVFLFVHNFAFLIKIDPIHIKFENRSSKFAANGHIHRQIWFWSFIYLKDWIVTKRKKHIYLFHILFLRFLTFFTFGILNYFYPWFFTFRRSYLRTGPAIWAHGRVFFYGGEGLELCQGKSSRIEICSRWLRHFGIKIATFRWAAIFH